MGGAGSHMVYSNMAAKQLQDNICSPKDITDLIKRPNQYRILCLTDLQ